MSYIPVYKLIGISKDRYIELLHYCRQYPEWKREASTLLGIRAVKQDGQPKGNGKSDPVALAAERRETLMEKIGIIDKCAKAVGDGEWYAAIIQNVCIGKAYEKMDKALMPTSYRHAFFAKKREFFSILDKIKDNKT